MSTANSASIASTDPRLALPPGSSDERRELVARMGLDLPDQGEWTADDYLDYTGRGVQFDRGRLEFTEMPNRFHGLMLRFLVRRLERLLDFDKIQIDGYRLRLSPTLYKEPDVLVTLTGEGWTDREATTADLVIEIVSDSPQDRHRDFVEKRADYEQARIPEYWIVDPVEKAITVLSLTDGSYTEHGVFDLGTTATSVIVPDFRVDVTDLFQTAGVISE